jgi:transcription elongation GreA/GreB family factor
MRHIPFFPRITMDLNKRHILQLILDRLAHDLNVQFTGAKTAHEASTHEENIPDNKYETLALEASYLAQGQANRAREIRQAVEVYRQLTLQSFDEDSPIRLSALVTLTDEDTATKRVFIGPVEGGLKVECGGSEVMVITPASPLGKDLIGRKVGDIVRVGTGTGTREYEIIGVS